MTASWSGPHTGSTEYKRGSRIDRGQWQAPLGSSRGQPPDRRQPAAVLASGGAEETLSLTAAARDGDGNMPSGRKNARGAGRTEEWNDMTKDNKSRVMLPLTKTAPYKSRMPELGPYGSVRGARGNSRPYRDSANLLAKSTFLAS